MEGRTQRQKRRRICGGREDQQGGRLCRGVFAAVFSPLRFVESPGKPFLSEADAFMAGYGAGRRIVDDLFNS